MRSVSYRLRGHPFHALVWGEEGHPLVILLHGFPEFSGAWEEVAPRLAAEGWLCVAPDGRGHGRSWRPEGVEPYAMRELVGDAVATIERFGGGRAAAVVGHDWGASVAYALAFRHPQAPGPARGPQRRPPRRLPGGAGRWRRAGGGEPVHPLAPARGLREDADGRRPRAALGPRRRPRRPDAARAAPGLRGGRGGKAGLRAMVNWYRASPLLVLTPGETVPPAALPDWNRARVRVTVPHLVIWGMRDVAFVPELRFGAAPFSDAFELEEIAQADPWVIRQEPERVAARIARFLAPEAP